MNLDLGSIVRVRSRQYLVEDVVVPHDATEDTLVRLACLDDDAQGQILEVLWEREVDARVIGTSTWEAVARRGFDEPRLFSAYLHTLRWNCVTSTNAKLFQAPYRAGIQVKDYQLEPLRKALLLPRVNLFIADDVGLGKTIEAGLILRELLMRQKVRRTLICCPPSVVRQWRDEMESRFGLSFVVFDRDFVATMRQQRGWSTNPWTTHTRFILSHALLRDETYAAPLRDWLGVFAPGSLLILDEAHNAAPASGARYAIDSHLTRTVRDVAPRFEHKLFLSATPHNGHSNSFAALLEMLDPQRFCRGVPVRSPKVLDAVMVRRLKSDLRKVGSHFPERDVKPIVVDGLPEDAPELVLSRLLQAYRRLREQRLEGATRSDRNAAMLVITSLQKRLLSSIEAFACTLRVHRAAMERRAATRPTAIGPAQMPLLGEAPGADDERADLDEADVQAEDDAAIEAATLRAETTCQSNQAELDLLARMSEIAQAARHLPDPRVARLVAWLRENACLNLGQPGATWSDRRVILFTEYADTKRYLVARLEEAIAASDQAESRIRTFHGGMGEDAREEVKLAFNADPARHPLRILVATDAAREGINLQNHCADLFHFDVPWNPSRMEQRNGRIDRHLQAAPVVRCRYFVLPQRAEDRVLEVLVEKTARIRRELGIVSPVIDRHVARLLEAGIRDSDVEALRRSLETVDSPDAQDGGAPTGKRSSRHDPFIEAELEQTRKREQDLAGQVQELQKLLQESRDWLRLDGTHFRDALTASLEMLGAEGLAPLEAARAGQDESHVRWRVPALDARAGADPSWAETFDALRAPRKRTQKPWEWRREAPVRPVVFADPGTLDGEVVHLHLEHRLVQRLLGRFLAQGFLHDELTRACVCLTREPQPKVIALGRLSLYGERASRLHDEILAVAAEWSDPAARGRKRLAPLDEEGKRDALEELEASLGSPALRDVSPHIRAHLMAFAAGDVVDLIPHLARRADKRAERARTDLTRRGDREAVEMVKILEDQRARIASRLREVDASQLTLGFDEAERRQLDADRRYWPERLGAIDREIIDEPARIRATYDVKAVRVEPVGLVYLWPVSA